MKRSELKRGKGLSRVPKAKGHAAPLSELPRVMWGERARRLRCAICGARYPDGHHVIPKRYLKTNDLQDFLWDQRNMLPLCSGCHDRHERAFARVPREKLSASNLLFIETIGIVEPWPDWLASSYPVSVDE